MLSKSLSVFFVQVAKSLSQKVGALERENLPPSAPELFSAS